jgi:hypothetical protein
MNRNSNPYKKAGEVLKINFAPTSALSVSHIPAIPPSQAIKITPKTTPPAPPSQLPQKSTHSHSKNLSIEYKFSDKDITDPEVWGPSFWFSIHNGSLSYPENASPIVAERLKGFILGLPYMLPCSACRLHAISYIEEKTSKLDEICRGRDNLFNFFVDFHNYVNAKSGKKIYSYEEARDLYNKKANVQVMKFK